MSSSSSSSFRVKPANYRGTSIGIGCFSCFSYRRTDQSTMGSQLSKKGGGEPSTTIGVDANSQYTAELRSYKAACQLDPDLQLFDNTLQARTTRVMSSLANGVEIRALTFESLKDVTGCLLDMNQEVVKVILECRKDIWKNEELFDLVEEYFENSLQTLDFCTSLENCLKRARDSQLIIHVALQQFEEAGDGWYQRTLDELKNFRECGSPFTEEFFQLFLSVYRQQIVMLEKLQTRKNKLNKKIRSIKIWRKVSSVIFVVALTTVLICTVVAAAMAAPPVASALAAASSIPIGSMGKWIDSLWKKYEDALVGQKETVSAMQVGGYVAIKDLDNVRALMMILENEIELMLKNVDFALERDKDEDAIKSVIREIKKKLKVFINSIEDLERQADKCSGDIVKARTVVLQRIIKYPN